MENENDSHDLFEEQLRLLKPQSASPELKARIDQSLENQNKRSSVKIGIITLVAMAVVMITTAWWIATNTVSPGNVPNGQYSVGHQQVLIEASEPVFLEIPGSGPMWKIDLKLQNRFFVQTPEGMKSSDFLAENRTVLVPVVYQ